MAECEGLVVVGGVFPNSANAEDYESEFAGF
jgi:hypothetical protein